MVSVPIPLLELADGGLLTFGHGEGRCVWEYDQGLERKNIISNKLDKQSG